MESESLDAILEDFTTGEAAAPEPRVAITLWVSPTDKGLYDSLQKQSRKRFCRKLTKLAVTAIRKCAAVEPKAS